METPEIVRRLLSRPVTPARALKVLHLLESPGQLGDEIQGAMLHLREAETDPHGPVHVAYTVIGETLTESVVKAHFARRPR